MRQLVVCALLVVCGCSGKSDGGKPDGGKPDGGKPDGGKPDGGKPDDPLAALPQTLEVVYAGGNAEMWGKKLLDANEDTCRDAAAALSTIGKEGLRFVAKGLQSNTVHVTSWSLRTLNVEAAKPYPGEFVPLLTPLLTRSSQMVRTLAIIALEKARFKDGLPALKKALDNEKDPDVKDAIERAIVTLEK